MVFGEWLAAVVVLLLALYGCAQLIRRLCLWVTRCPRSVTCLRLALPQCRGAIEPLFRCLQAQAAWADTRTECTLVVLPPLNEEQRQMVERLQNENPAVMAMTAQELAAIAAVMQEE
jgi:hypothetical protein